MMWLGIYGDETVGGEAIGLVVGRYDLKLTSHNRIAVGFDRFALLFWIRIHSTAPSTR
jgi:hypothetical protein